MRLLQVCNVGRIVGGTAACAWTVTRALPALEHYVRFLSPPDRETLSVFAGCDVSHDGELSAEEVARVRPDIVLLHNISCARVVGSWTAPTVQYLHSAIAVPSKADATVCCSRWLAERIGLPRSCVLWQAVPTCAPAEGSGVPTRRDAGGKVRLTVGRLCTPQPRKWPQSLIPFYRRLSEESPHVDWEFVGCPGGMESALGAACRGRAVFHPAGWSRRSLLSRWDVLLYSNPGLPESFGRVVAEAMRAGCVPVVDRRGGFIEQIPNGAGFLCQGARDFVEALRRLSDGTIRRRMSDAAVRHADERFSLARFARELLMWFTRASRTAANGRT
jgi:glycosyltransferase involved in cell wall biosynthesis